MQRTVTPQWLGLALEAADAAIWEWDLRTDRIAWSDAMLRLFGVDPASVEQGGDGWSPWRSRLHPDDRQGTERAVRAAARERAALSLRYRIVLPDGRTRWIETRGAVHCDPEDRPVAVLGLSLDVTERQEARGRSAQWEAERLDWLDRLPMAVAVVALGEDAEVLFLNGQFVRTFGYRLEDMPRVSDWASKAYPDADYREAVFRRWDQAVARALESDGHVETVEVRVVCKDGSVRDVLIGAVAGNDRLLVSCADLTELRQAEADLRTLREGLERTAFELTENIPVGTYTMVLPPGADTAHFSFLSKRFLELAGLDRDTVLADPLRAFACVHPDERRRWLKLNLEAFASKGPFFGETRILVDGAVRWITAESIPRARPDGSTVWEGVLTDITERKAAEERLRQSESRFRDLFEYSPLAYQSLDESGRYLDLNSELCALLGYEREELIGRSFGDFWSPGTSARFPAVFDRFKCRGSTSGELELVRKDGSLVTVLLEGRIQRTPDDRIARTHCTLYDITERKHRERELEEARIAASAASQAKSEFLALMSHELRTPMNAVLGLAQILERGPLAPGQRDMVERIRIAGGSLLGLLNDLLDFSKIEAGRLEIEPRPFRLPVLVDKVVRLLGESARAKGIALQVEVESVPPWALLGDAMRLEQVLVNLVGNAIKFTERGEVRVRIACLGASEGRARLRVAVADTGIGIAPETIDRLFEPFVQAEAGTARRFGGTGLGLAICKRLVGLMGGEMGALSRLGQGSTFWLELSLPRGSLDDQALASIPCPVTHGQPRLQGLHLLLVDDSAPNRDLAERALALEGATATPAADGREALDILRTRPGDFDAVLMDIRMPGMDGLTATRLIRGELGLAGLPVVALTAGVMAEEREAALAAGVDGILAKPLDIEEMTAVLQRWTAPAEGAEDTARGLVSAGLGASLVAGLGIADIDPSRIGPLLTRDPLLLRRLLGRFAADHGDAAARVRRALAEGDRAGAEGRLHRLKGDAANLGAAALAGLAGELEQALARRAPLSDLDEGLVRLDGRVAALLRASAPWPGAPAAPGPDAAPAAAGSARLDPVRLAALREALRTNNTKARRLLDELEPALAGALGAETARSLGEAIRDLRFDGALDLLEQAMAGLGGEPPEWGGSDAR